MCGNFKIGNIFDWMELFLYCLCSRMATFNQRVMTKGANHSNVSQKRALLSWTLPKQLIFQSKLFLITRCKYKPGNTVIHSQLYFKSKFRVTRGICTKRTKLSLIQSKYFIFCHKECIWERWIWVFWWVYRVHCREETFFRTLGNVHWMGMRRWITFLARHFEMNG